MKLSNFYSIQSICILSPFVSKVVYLGPAVV